MSEQESYVHRSIGDDRLIQRLRARNARLHRQVRLLHEQSIRGIGWLDLLKLSIEKLWQNLITHLQ